MKAKQQQSLAAFAAYLVTLIPAGQSDPIGFECQADEPAHAVEQAENAYPGAMVLYTQVEVPLQLTLRVRYLLDPKEDDPQKLLDALQARMQQLWDNGDIASATTQFPLDSQVSGRILPVPLSEPALAAFMRERIENGEVSARDVPRRLARYGLMDPAAFVDEMRERMDGEKQQPTQDYDAVRMAARHLKPGDLVDLQSCPHLKDHPTAAFLWAEVDAVEPETAGCVAISYVDIDTIGYPPDTLLRVVSPANHHAGVSTSAPSTEG